MAELIPVQCLNSQFQIFFDPSVLLIPACPETKRADKWFQLTEVILAFSAMICNVENLSLNLRMNIVRISKCVLFLFM